MKVYTDKMPWKLQCPVSIPAIVLTAKESKVWCQANGDMQTCDLIAEVRLKAQIIIENSSDDPTVLICDNKGIVLDYISESK